MDPLFFIPKKMEKRKKKGEEGTPRTSHRCCFHRENIDSIIKVTGQTRLPLAAKKYKKAFRIAFPSRSTRYLYP